MKALNLSFKLLLAALVSIAVLTPATRASAQSINGLNVSPLVSNISPDRLRKIEGALIRKAEVKTAYDYLNTPLAATHVLQTTARSQANPAATAAPPVVSSTVQTIDYTFATEFPVATDPDQVLPTPAPTNTPTNIDPVWSPDATFLVFSSNMTSSGATGSNFHLWAVAASGGAAVQLTTGSGDERWPTLVSDTQIAYCESTNDGTSYQLETALISNSSTGAFLPSLSNEIAVTFTDISARPITDVRHPSWVGDLIAFSGLSGQSPQHHIYYYSVSNGLTSGQAAQLTSGAADEENPSVNTVGNLIAFDSNASTNYTYSSTDSTPLSFSGTPAAVRNIFVAVASGVGGTLQYTQDAGTNNIEPDWSYVPPSLVVPTGYYLWFSSNRTTAGKYGIYYDFALATNTTQVLAENNEPNTVQTVAITGSPTGGSFSLTYEGSTVTGIPYNATAQTVQTALQSLASVNADQQTVTVTVDRFFAQAYDVSFAGPAVVPVGLLSGSSQMTGGTNPAVTVSATGTQNPAVPLLTSDPSTNSPIGGFNNYEPAVPQLQQNFYEIAYVSPRFIVNNIDDNPLDNAGAPPAATTGAEPVNTATSPPGAFSPTNSSLAPTGGFEILASEFFDINPPALLRYSTAQIIRTFNNADSTSMSPVRFVPAGGTVNFTVRLSERQAGVGQVYLQIKNPNSKYQGQDGLEHKVFTHLSTSEGPGPALALPYPVDPNNPGTVQVSARNQGFTGNPLRMDSDEATDLYSLQPQPAEGGQGVDLGQMLTYTPQGLTQRGPTPGTNPPVNDGNVSFATISANAATGATTLSLTGVNALGISAVSYVNQTLTVNGSPTGGTFTITYDGDTTNPIPYNTVASGVQDAINNLPNIQAASMFATVTGNTTTPVPPAVSGPFNISLPGADSEFVIDNSNLVPNGVAQVTDTVAPGQAAGFYGDPYHLAGAILQLYGPNHNPTEKVQILSSNYAYPGASPWGGTFNITPLLGTYVAGALPAGYAAIVKLSEFDPQGSEVDCQAIDAGTTSQITALSAASLSPYYQIPPYTPGLSDAAPLLGVGAQGDGSLENSPPVNPNTGDDVWLPLKQVPSDGQGGVLYEGTWATPTEPSDYYIDVVAYDNSETNPYIQQIQPYAGQNWRIYDNVWGISTQPFVAHTSPSGVLVVNDYMLPQKFFNGQRFGTLANQPGSSNIPVNYFGSESYITDLDAKWSDTNGMLGSLPSAGYILNDKTTATMTQLYHVAQVGPSSQLEGYTPFYPNGLGVNSYLDDDQTNAIQIDTAPTDVLDTADISNGIGTTYSNGSVEAPSQSYDIWRILSRGAIPETILDAYGAQQTPQPANPLVTGSKASNILAAPSCVIWSSPFAGDEFADSGTIVDPPTQTELTRFVDAGGRLLVEGIDVGFAMTGGGSTPTDFYSSILDAKFQTDSAQLTNGAAILTLNGSANQTDYISKDAFINSDGDFGDVGAIGHDNFAFLNSADKVVYTPPSSAPLQLAGIPPVVGEVDNPNNRTDGSLADGGSDYLSFIDAFTNLGTAPPANGLITTLPAEATELKGSGANDQLEYTEFAPPTGVTFGGGIAAYASFGLESLSQEVAEISAPYPMFSVYAQRSNVLHNLICFMRTGTLSGQVTSANGGTAVPGAIVIATPDGMSAPSFTGTTNANGAYSILGVPPGKYDLTAYSPGTDFFQHNNGSAVFVHGGDTGNLNIQVSPSQPGSLPVEVEDATTMAPIGGATVNLFLNATPLATTPPYTGTTGVSTGLVNFSSVTAGSYLVFATASGYATNSPGVAVIVTPQGNTPSTAKGPLIVRLSKSPGSVTGTVTNSSGTGLQGATITVTAVAPTTGGPYSTTTNASGVYTVANVPPGTYSVSAADTSYITQTQTPITVSSGVPVTVNFTLSTSPMTKVYGYVSRTDTGAAVATGSTVTFTDKTNPSNIQTATTIATFTGPDGKPANYQIPNMPYGTYTGSATVSGLGTVNLASPVTVNTPTSQRVDFTYKLSVIYGLVSQSANNTAIPGATVTLTPTSGTALTATTVAPFTGPDGNTANFKFASPVPFGAYTASVVATGYPSPPSQAITVNAGSQRVNFAVQPIHSFAGGLQMFSLPFDYTSSSYSLSQIFGYTNPKIALWEPNENAYTFPSTIQIGVGYWVRFPAAEGLLLAGTPVANTKAVSIPLTPGWNMIGDPYASALPTSSITVSDSTGNTMSLAAAGSGGLISPTYYTYDTGTGQYDSFSATAPGNSLQAYSGYWIQAFSSATINLGPLQAGS